MRTTIGRAWTVFGLVAAALAACDDEPKSGNGVNDIRASCEIRTMCNRNGNDCTVCEAAVVAPRCECSSLAAFSGACLEQANQRKSACSDAVDDCVNACQRTDCACIDGCYKTADYCKAASAARDGCITDTCDSHCK